MKDSTKSLKKQLRAKRPKLDETIPASALLSSGSTLLNKACSGRIIGAFAKGKYYHFVGDSDSGKTFITLTCLAEAARNKNFDNYRFVHDNGEDGALMNIRKLFGNAVADRIEPPKVDKDGTPLYSETTDDFYFNVMDALEGGVPFIWIQDSMDVLTANESDKKFAERRKAHKTGEDTKGDYGMAKAKQNSENLRRLINRLRTSESILIVISQTRDDTGYGFNPKTYAGGHALKFYATLQMWSSRTGSIEKTVKGKPREQGITVKVKVKKNRITGKKRTVEFPIYHSYGIDDTGSCIDYLKAEGHWKEHKGVIKAPEFNFNGRRADLIKKIENENKQKELRKLVGRVWDEIEDATALKRKPRYE